MCCVPDYAIVSSVFEACTFSLCRLAGVRFSRASLYSCAFHSCYLASAETWRAITGEEPRVAMLSFSSNGSARHPCVANVQQATEIVRERAPKLVVDGELQFDAAFVPEVAAQKAPASPLQGKANVMVFPSLEAGNIGYKIAQRLGGYRAVGPLIQGLAAPMHDLSRGCSVQEIIELALVAAVPRQTEVNRESSLQTLVE